jgi:hypothetical protein
MTDDNARRCLAFYANLGFGTRRGQNGPRVTRRSYLAPGAEQSSRARKVEQLIA